MTTKPLYEFGDRVEVLVGSDWHLAYVAEVGEWSSQSGNSYPVYKVRFDADGDEILCGHNSMRAAE